MVYLTEASFTNLEFSSDITLNISASYNHVYKLTGIETVSRFKTPKCKFLLYITSQNPFEPSIIKFHANIEGLM